MLVRKTHSLMSVFGPSMLMHYKQEITSFHRQDLTLIIHSDKFFDTQEIQVVIRQLLEKHDKFLQSIPLEYALAKKVLHISLVDFNYSCGKPPPYNCISGIAGAANLISGQAFTEIYSFHELTTEETSFVVSHEIGHVLDYFTTDEISVFRGISEGWATKVQRGDMDCPLSTIPRELTLYLAADSSMDIRYNSGAYFVDYLAKKHPTDLFELLSKRAFIEIDSHHHPINLTTHYAEKHQAGFNYWIDGDCIASTGRMPPTVSPTTNHLDQKLLSAIYDKDNGKIQTFLDEGSNPNYSDPYTGKKPLHLFFDWGYCDAKVVEILKHAGADTHAYDNEGRSIYKAASDHCGTSDQWPAIESLLLKNNKPTTHLSERLLTTASSVSKQPTDDLIRPLLLAMSSRDKARIYTLLKEEIADPNYSSPYTGNTLLHLLFGWGNCDAETVEMLIRAGASTNAHNNKGVSIREMAFSHCETSGQWPAIDALLNGKRPVIYPSTSPAPMWSEQLLRTGNLNAVKEAIARGQLNPEGRTTAGIPYFLLPVQQACEHEEHYTTVLYLLGYGDNRIALDTCSPALAIASECVTPRQFILDQCRSFFSRRSQNPHQSVSYETVDFIQPISDEFPNFPRRSNVTEIKGSSTVVPFTPLKGVTQF